MVRFMLVTFAFLAWAFYTMSGGSDFNPDRARLDDARSDPLKVDGASEPEASEPETASAETLAGGIEVTRVSLDLTSVDVGPADETGTAAASTPEPRPAVRTTDQSDPVEIIPSLVENATPDAGFAESSQSGTEQVPESVSVETGSDIRVVSGTRVNVRGGPGTSHGILDTLNLGDEVEVLDESGTGWVRIRAGNAGIEGWMAASLLTRG